MAHALGISVIFSALFTASFSITVNILEPSTVVQAGDNHTIHCIVDLTTTNFTAADVIWIKDYSMKVDHHAHTTLNDSVARLHIVDAAFEDVGHYYCTFPGQQFADYFRNAAATVYVGLPPEPVQNLECYTFNILDFTCEWEDGVFNNFKTDDVLHYQGDLSEGQPPEICTPQREVNYCTVTCHASQDNIYVVSSNELGNATARLGRVFSPFDEVRPHPPESIQGEATEPRKIAMSWEKPEDWRSPSYGLVFWMQYQKEGQEWQNISSESIKTAKSYTLTALDPYTTYNVRLSCSYDVLVNHNVHRGINPFGAWSEPLEITTMAEVPAAMLDGLNVQHTVSHGYTRDVFLEWEAIPESEYRGPNFQYNVSVEDTNGQVVKYEETTNTLLRMSDLDRFAELTIFVTPFNDVGFGSNPGRVTLDDETEIPSRPENLRVRSESESLEVSWESPTPITGHVLNYRVEWYPNNDHSQSTSIDVSADARSYMISGLEPYTKYRISVRTVNKKDRSPEASMLVDTAQTGPSGSPTSLGAAAVPTHPDQLEVTWEEVPIEQRNGEIQYYTIFYCPLDPAQGQDPPITVSLATDSHCPDGSQLSVNVTGAPRPQSHTLSDLTPYTEYIVRIAASTFAGQGPISSRVQAKTSQGPPSKPRDLLVTFSNESSIQLEWEAPELMNGVFQNYVIEYNGEVQSSIDESITLEVFGFVNYTVRVRACSHAEPSLACGQSVVTYVLTDIGAPSAVTDIDVNLETQDTVVLSWERPFAANGPLDYYVVRYRPVDSDLEWQESPPTSWRSATVQIDCDLVDGATFFNFEVFAVNEVDGIPRAGAMSPAHPFEVCNLHEVPVVTIVLAILLPSFVVIVIFCFLIWVKQSDLFKPAPDPYFIDAVLDHNDEKFQMHGRLLSMRSEGEKFDTIRQANSSTNLLLPPYDRLSSKESTSTSSSTDQGIHDMDGFSEEQRYVRENTGSRSTSESDEEKACAPAKQMMRIMSDDYEEEDTVFGADCDGSVTYSRIAEMDGADCSTPMLGKEAAQYVSDGSEGYSQLSQVPLQASTTPPAPIRGLSDQRSEASFGSQSTVSYHRLGMSGLTPITSVETLPSEDPLAYARLSQGSETDIEYSQLAASSSNPTLAESRATRVPQAEQRVGTTPEIKGVAMSLPSVSAGGCIQPPQEFIVATALSPGNHPHPVPQPDISGYVTSPPATKLPPPAKHVSPEMSKKHMKGSHKNLADTKSQSGSDSSLTDGEGYSTLGLADSPTSSAPHHPHKVDKSKPSVSPPPVPVDNGYVPKDMVAPRAPAAIPPSAPKTNASGYITEAELQAIPHPPCVADPVIDSRNALPVSIPSPNKHVPNGLPKVGANGYVSKHDMPPPPKTAGQPLTNHSAANPYITPEQMARIPQASTIPPSTPSPPPSPPLNNNHPPGKEYRPDNPYVGIGMDHNIPSLTA